MTEPYGAEQTATFGDTLTIYTIDDLQNFVDNVVTNYYSTSGDLYMDNMYPP